MDSYIQNDNPIVTELSDPFCTHFGVLPEFSHIRDCEMPIIDCGPNEDGTARRHDNTQVETMLWRAPDVTAWVSGSWKCWGPQDQGTEGDLSLHVAVYTPEMPSRALLSDMWESLHLDVHDGRGVLLHHAYITKRDHSEILYVVTFGSDEITIFPVKEDIHV